MQRPTKIAYICDCKKKCRYYGMCQINCFHTFNDLHTKNGVIHHVDELKTDRFRKIAIVDDVVYYEEVLNNEESSESNP